MTIKEYKEKELNKDLKPVHITFVIDRSGSMSSIASDVEGGVNSFIKDQSQLPGECKVTVWEFAKNGILAVNKTIDAKSVKTAIYDNFKPSGSTPLYDAIGKAILDTDQRDKEEKQIFVIMTDGHENSSREFTKDKIADLIKDREEKGWIFTYLAANQDAFAVGGGMGFNAVMDYKPDSIGTRTLYAANSQAVSNARSTWSRGGAVMSSNFYDPDAQLATTNEPKPIKWVDENDDVTKDENINCPMRTKR